MLCHYQAAVPIPPAARASQMGIQIYFSHRRNVGGCTVEPGIYISDRLAVPKGQPEIDERWKGIGIRIEDDVLVTKDSVEVLSLSAAKNVIDLEK